MNYIQTNLISLIPDSENPDADQRDFGFFIRDGKYFVIENRKEDRVTKELSNFTMVSLYNLINGSNNSKRIIKIQRNTGEIRLVEVLSSEMRPDAIETILKSNRCTFFGTAYQLKLIIRRLMDTEADAIILTVLGWNQEHRVYVFADAIFFKGKILEVDPMGIIKADNKLFYLPAFGMANEGNEEFETDKLYSFKSGEIGFGEWAKLFYQAFGANGMIGILFLILSVFRDVVFKQVQFFPFLFLFGDFGTGKTSFVERLLSLFGTDIIGTPLNNATSIALSRLSSTRINSLFYFKEYTNETDGKVQDFILNAYDGAGRTTGVKSNDNKTKTFPVRSGLIFDGNNLPTQKTAILSRMILLNFEESRFTEDQKAAYGKLKISAEFGLGKVLIDILATRELFEKMFKESFFQNVKDLKEEYVSSFPERTLNHIALIMAPAKILWNDLHFPVPFEEMLDYMIRNSENQNEILKGSSAISIFWESFSNSYKKGYINLFDGNNPKAAYFNIKEMGNNSGIIQIKLANLYPLYVRHCKDNSVQFADQSSLRLLLTSEANKDFIHGAQKGRGSAYTDKNFGSCYQFKFTKTGNSIYISEVEINL